MTDAGRMTRDDARGADRPSARWGMATTVAAAGLAGVCILMSLVTMADTRLVTAVHGHPIPLGILVSATTPRWAFLALALPIVLGLTTKYPPWPLAARTLLVQVVLFAGLTGLHALVHSTVTSAPDVIVPSGPIGFTMRFVRVVISSMPIILPLYGATLLTAWGIDQARERRWRALRTAQLETQLHAARLAALRAQLNPHFLYNTLNGIAALVHDRRPNEASGALEQLAELLHAAFRDDGREVIPLSEEVELVDRYLALQQLRFGDRLSYDIAIDTPSGATLVPPLILQPLVENAVLHGLARRDGPMLLTVRGATIGDRTTVTISQDGPTLPANWSPATGSGLGLRNTRDRLTSAFGAHGGLSLRARAGGGVEAIVQVPAGTGHDASRPSHTMQPA